MTDDVRARGSVPHARDDATVTDPSSDDSMDVTERTRLAFENARARNPSLLPGPPRSTPRAPAAPRQEISPVRNPYPQASSPQSTLRSPLPSGTPPRAAATVLPPPEPPPTPSSMDFPHGSLAAALLHPPEPTHHSVPWTGRTSPTSVISVAHVLGSPRVCGIDGADNITITIAPTNDSCPLIDGGSNICIMGDASLLVDTVDIPPVAILVALAGGPSSFDDTITKQGLLPLTLSDGTTYYQPCYFCANMVETIILPAAVLASSDWFYYWTQVGCKDPDTPGSLVFTSRDG